MSGEPNGDLVLGRSWGGRGRRALRNLLVGETIAASPMRSRVEVVEIRMRSRTTIGRCISSG
jgi:hypothetical protein